MSAGPGRQAWQWQAWECRLSSSHWASCRQSQGWCLLRVLQVVPLRWLWWQALQQGWRPQWALAQRLKRLLRLLGWGWGWCLLCLPLVTRMGLSETTSDHFSRQAAFQP